MNADCEEDFDDGDDTESEFYGEACPYLDYYRLWPLYLKKYYKLNDSEDAFEEIDIRDLMELK